MKPYLRSLVPITLGLLLNDRPLMAADTNAPNAYLAQSAISNTHPTRASSSKPPIYTRLDMEADLNHLTRCVKRAWAYAEDKRAWLGVDPDALRAAALSELDQVHDADDFYFVVQKYVGGLMDGHAGVRPGHSPSRISTPFQWPFVVTRLEGHFYVKALEGECGPLRPGDELLTLNGVAVRERFETALARSTGSTPAGRERRALGPRCRPRKPPSVRPSRNSTTRAPWSSICAATAAGPMPWATFWLISSATLRRIRFTTRSGPAPRKTWRPCPSSLM